jgi:hypothetical protein
MKDLKKMNKNALEEYGRKCGIELDRRLTKKALIKQLTEHIATGSETIEENEEELSSIPETRGVVSQKVLLRDKNTGHFSKGPQPAGASNGRSGGVPYWEV